MPNTLAVGGGVSAGSVGVFVARWLFQVLTAPVEVTPEPYCGISQCQSFVDTAVATANQCEFPITPEPGDLITFANFAIPWLAGLLPAARTSCFALGLLVGVGAGPVLDFLLLVRVYWLARSLKVSSALYRAVAPKPHPLYPIQ